MVGKKMQTSKERKCKNIPSQSKNTIFKKYLNEFIHQNGFSRCPAATGSTLYKPLHGYF